MEFPPEHPTHWQGVTRWGQLTPTGSSQNRIPGGLRIVTATVPAGNEDARRETVPITGWMAH